MTKNKGYKLVILESAQDELEEIADMRKSLVGFASARKIIKRIYSALRHLRDHPYMGIALEETELAHQGYRKLICGDYLCFLSRDWQCDSRLPCRRWPNGI
jgi:plasmid stabilization system protein ParE